MFKRFLLFLLVTAVQFLYAQNDTVKRGTISVVKSKDSTFVYSYIQFYKFTDNADGKDKMRMTYAELVEDIKNNKNNTKAVLIPHPKSVDETLAFDYTSYFRYHPEMKSIVLPDDKETDTVRIMVYVTKKGDVIATDLSPSKQIGKVLAKYDSVNQVYNVDIVHFKTRKAFMQLTKNKWEPAYLLQSEVADFKRRTVIKPKKKEVNATGVLTVIVSKKSFKLR